MKSVFYYPNGYKLNGENHVTPFLTLLLKTSDDLQNGGGAGKNFTMDISPFEFISI
jgi:hypothetical protein